MITLGTADLTRIKYRIILYRDSMVPKSTRIDKQSKARPSESYREEAGSTDSPWK